jgi:hypothetical protein
MRRAMHTMQLRRRTGLLACGAALALAAWGAASALARSGGDPSTADAGSISVTTSAKVVAKHGHYTITVAGQVPAPGYIYLLWTDATKIKHGCPPLATEGSFVDNGFGGTLIGYLESPAGPFSAVKAHLTGKAGLEYQFCGYVRFIGQQGETELGAGVVVKIK